MGLSKKRLNHSTLIAFSLLLSIYALLPEHLRFSRGILVLGSVLAFILMTIIRLIFIKWKIIEQDDRSDEHRQTFIIGTNAEFEQANSIMQNAGMEERVLGRIGVNVEEVKGTGRIEDLKELLKTYPIKEIIFCEGTLSFKKIISIVKYIPQQVRLKFYSAGATGIIGSDNTNTSGKLISPDKTPPFFKADN